MIVRTLVALSVTLLCLTSAVGQPADPWPMFRGNGEHVGRANVAGPELPSLLWKRPLESGSYSSPAVGRGGNVYVGASDVLSAFTDDGTLRWEASLEDFSIVSPALTADRVFSASTSGRVYAFATNTGTMLWSYSTGGEVWASPVLAPDGTVHIASSNGLLIALDDSTGSVRWQYTLSSSAFSSPAISADGILCAVDQDGSGVLLDADDGTFVAGFSVDAEVVASPAFGPNGLLIVGSTDGTLFGLDASAGQIRWTAELGGQIIASPAITVDGTVIAGSSDGVLFALDSRSGAVRWSTSLDGELYSSPLLDNENRIYVGTVGTDRILGHLYGLDASTGDVLWNLETAGPIWSSPAIDGNGTLLVTTAGEDDIPAELMAVEPSLLFVDPAEEPVAGNEHAVDVRSASSFAPSSGTLFYRRGGERSYQSSPIEQSQDGNGYSAVVPSSFVTVRGLEYFIAMSDGDETRTYPTSQPESRPFVQRVRVPSIELPLSLRPRQYSMISVPLDLTSASPTEVLVDDYGPYHTSTWRLFHWDGSRYREYPDLGADFSAGMAHFLVHRTGKPFTVGGRSVDTSAPITVRLEPGWNQVAVPFAFEVDWDAVTTVDPSQRDAVREIAHFDGTEMIQDPASLNPLQPWTGYFVRNASSEPVEIAFPNVGVETDGEVAVATTTPTSHSTQQSSDYVLQLSAFSLDDERRDTQNWIGFRAGATNGDDRLDLREAPNFGEHVRLSIRESGSPFAANFKAHSDRGATWRVELSAHSSSTKRTWVEVAIDHLGTRPEGFQVHVIDEDRTQTLALIDDRFRIDVKPDEARNLTVIVGDAGYAAASLQGARPHPETYYLDASYPNPFGSSTMIPFGLETESDVTIEVFDAIGRRVAVLVDGSLAAGRHVTDWDGRSRAGVEMASGIYFVRMKTDGFSSTRQVVLSR